MPRTSCIQPPAHNRLLVLYEWQIQACQGNMCAGALLSFFEYWHTVKLSSRQQARAMNATAAKHGDEQTQDDSLFQWHTSTELQTGILGLYGESVILRAVKQLESLGFISIHKNPNPKYKFDRTNFYLFHPEAVQAWITRNFPEDAIMVDTSQKDTNEEVNLPNRDSKNTESMSQKYGMDGSKNTGAISLTTTETTPEITEKDPPIAPQGGECEKRFEQFWREYPRKEAKGRALKVWKRIKPSRPLLDRILTSLSHQKDSPQWTRDHGKFIPHPATWLNDQRWDDETQTTTTTWTYKPWPGEEEHA